MLLALLLPAALASDPGPSTPAPADVASTCTRVAATPFPAADAPTAAELPGLAGCDAEALYYGIGAPADPERARLCAYAQRAASATGVYEGDAILLLVYANGRGAPRNVDLALRLACGLDSAPAERDGRVEHLLSLDPATTFDLCDDITSGFMMGACSAHQVRMDAGARAERRSRTVAALPPAARAALPALDAAAEAFFRARVEGEVDLSGTARAAMQIDEQLALEDGYAQALESVGSAAFPPPADAAARAAADDTLNVAYRVIMKGKGWSYGTVTRADVRTAERAWIAYRDAWVAFGAVAAPAVSEDAWVTWLTEARTQQLSELIP